MRAQIASRQPKCVTQLGVAGLQRPTEAGQPEEIPRSKGAGLTPTIAVGRPPALQPNRRVTLRHVRELLRKQLIRKDDECGQRSARPACFPVKSMSVGGEEPPDSSL